MLEQSKKVKQMKLSTVYGFLKKDLQEIEGTLTNVIGADHPVLNEASLQLLQAGGKRIRPVFVLLSSRMNGNQKHEEAVKTVAVALELIHMATLVHDDVVDDAALRRGKPTVKHLYGGRVAMYTGDYMLARALEEITTVRVPKIHQALSKTLVNVVEGEIAQIKDKYNTEQTVRDYLRRIKRKTALLIATSCKLGALAANMSYREANQMYRYGYNVGMSFQIIDDILDFTASEKELGKPTASDLIQGNMTLPIFYAMKDPVFKKVLQDVFQYPNQVNTATIQPVLQLLDETEAIEQAYQVSNAYLQKALQELKSFPNSKAKKTLQMIAVSIGKRRS